MLEATEKECDGGDLEYKRLKTLDECADHCKKHAGMFVYGIGDRCTDDGCRCYCETSNANIKTCTLIEEESRSCSLAYEYIEKMI